MATNTTSTATTHTGNGSTNNFAISFSFLANNEVDVTVAGVLKTLDTHYTISGSTVTFTSGNTPANGAAVKFQRDTDISAKKVDFQDGSVLTETDLDTNSDQVLFAQQEITDKLGGIEEGATADQTNAEIKTAYEANSDTNAFTDALQSKLNAIEAGATGDQTNAEIRAAVEAASDSNVFTDADHSKLNAIEAGATADQTISEIKSLIAGSPLDASHLAANSVDSSELVDGSVDTSHLSTDCVTNAKIADDSIDSEHYVDGSIDTAHIGNSQVTTDKIADDAVTAAKLASNSVVEASIQDENVSTNKLTNNAVNESKIANNAVTTAKIADAELKTLAGMQSGTASKLADSTALTSDLADLNQLDGMAKQTTISDDDTKFPTSGAVVDYVAAQLAPIGGLEVIADDQSFPNTQPASGVVISIADAGGLVVDANGTSATARTANGTTVTINNFASNFNSSTVDAGVAIMVSSTGSGQVYNYHKATLKEADLLNLSNDINDFGNRYRVTDGEPSSNNDEGDLIYDKQADKMKVYDSTANAFKEVTSVGDFKFLFLCPVGGSGSPTINGSIASYDLREGSNNGAAASVTNAAQLLVSINGIVQRPNTGTSAPSEGFAMVDSNTIIFGTNIPSGAEVFVIQIGSAVALQVPADNTVSSAKLQNGSVIASKLSSGVADLVNDSSPQLGGDLATNGNNIRFGDSSDGSSDDVLSFGASNDLLIYHYQDSSYIQDNGTGPLQIYTNGTDIRFKTSDGEVMAKMIKDGAVELYHNASKKLETRSDGVLIGDSQGYYCGDGADLRMFFNGTDGYIRAEAGKLHLDKAGGEKFIVCNPDAAVEIYHDNVLRAYTTNVGLHVDTIVSVPDNGKFRCGNGDDLEIYHDGSNNYIDGNSAAEDHLYIRANVGSDHSSNIHLQAKAGEESIVCRDDEQVELYHDGTKKLETTSYGSQVTGYQVQTNFPIASVSDVNTGNLNTTTLQDAQLNSSNFYSYTILNQGNHFSASTGKFTCPVDGVYRIYFRISSTANANIRLRKNGNTINEAYDSGYSSGDTRSVSSEIIVGCSANDYLDIQVSTLRVVSGNQHKQVTFQLIA